METPSGRRRQVDIFNFSFLDILACVIGLLIFVLTIVAVTGGPARGLIKEQAARLAAADREVTSARLRADMAGKRRASAEQALAQRAATSLDPEAMGRSIRQEISGLDAEGERLRIASDRVSRQAGADRAEASRITADLNGAPARNPDLDLQDLHREAQRLREEAKKQGRETAVSYYVPRVRDSSRPYTIIVELDGDMLYVVTKANYRATNVGLSNSTRHDRRPNAHGVSITRLAAGEVQPPVEFRTFNASDLRLDVAVRPSAYGNFRKLRDWAMRQKYGVMCHPMRNDEVIYSSSDVSGKEQ